MKKVLLFVVLACVSLAVNAETKTYKLGTSNTWNCTPLMTGTLTVTFTSQWGEYQLSSLANGSTGIDVTEYPSYKVVVDEVSDEDAVQLKIQYGSSTDNQHCTDVNEAGTYTGDFLTDQDDDVLYFEIQGKLGESEYAVISAVYLIDADGNEVLQEYGGNNWGTTSQVDTDTFTFTGQYGYEELLDSDGNSVTFDPDTDEAFDITIKFGAALAETDSLIVEFDNDGSGFQWFNIDGDAAGTVDSYTFSVSSETASQKVEQIYIKASADAQYDGCYPFTVQFKSITSGDEPVVDTDYFVSLDFEGDNTAWTLYDGDKIEITTGGPADTEGNYLSVDFGNEAYGVGAFPASTDVIYQKSQSELPAGTYTISGTICVGGECDGLIDFYATNSDGTVYGSTTLSNSADYGVTTPASFEVTLTEDDYLTIGIKTNDSWDSSKYLWLYADNFGVEGGTTGITSVPAVTATGNGAIYNLAGQRVNAGTKGLLIIDGKKVLVK